MSNLMTLLYKYKNSKYLDYFRIFWYNCGTNFISMEQSIIDGCKIGCRESQKNLMDKCNKYREIYNG